MFWFTRLCQSKPMALPFVRPTKFSPERNVRGLDWIDERMSPETATSEQNEISPSYLGSGISGVAVNLPSGFVGKYTDDDYEARMAERCQRMQPPCVVNIHDVRLVQSRDMRYQKLYMIIMDRIQTLHPTEKWMVHYMCKLLGKNPSLSEDLIRQHFPEEYRNFSIISRYLDLLRCLSKYNVNKTDAHGDNVGYNSEGNLVLFDLG